MAIYYQVEFGLFMNPWQDTRFSNSSGIPIPSNILKLVSSEVGLDEMELKVLIDTADSQYKHNFIWENKQHNLKLYIMFLVFLHDFHKTLLVP